MGRSENLHDVAQAGPTRNRDGARSHGVLAFFDQLASANFKAQPIAVANFAADQHKADLFFWSAYQLKPIPARLA
jgi:hypothetical protein